ncbi:CerR family C-terminal domain-containing protein [Aquibium sp. ELW1220]|uniref:CerR family C-terminal domain-containing protein n=1 Tax=Aquibium sp. ELW1220 TaxID=2976766 RepID=UPI0025B23F4D|nr:CerR family C-terminal domain-containing protein [Aquibium sp. ELW1220]MDN2578610.1 CerR family C-terminal domain-containing protein [Aquibium sp. ELW1220]
MTTSTAAPDTSRDTSGADQTRLALIQAALKLFGQKGFDGTSTREIATAAKANIGSIAYHFGGKEGLRSACAEHIVEAVSAIAAQAIGPAAGALAGPMDRETARGILHAVAERFVMTVVGNPQAVPFVQFVLRELSQPTTALERIYDGVFEPNHKRFCLLWEKATGQPAASRQTMLTVFTIVGQVMYFRIAREAVTRRMGWADIGAAESKAIAATVCANIDAMVAAAREE